VDDEGSAAYRVAVVQVPPVFLDREATLARAVEQLDDAADAGARLVAFPEAFLPGYPEWIWRLRAGIDHALASEIWDRFVPQTIDLSRDELAPLRAAARRRGVVAALGISERDGEFSRATIYNTFVLIGADGEIQLRHRKLVPTNVERVIWGQGDGVGLDAVDTAVGRVGGLICWENYMPLARFALFAAGVQIYVAPTWDVGDLWVASMRHIATEGRCWVLGCGSLLRASDIPGDFPGRATLFPDEAETINPGGSVIVSPAGDIVAGPLDGVEGTLYAECDPARSLRAHRTLDVAGHYGRPDVFQVTIDRSPRQPVA
jgi:nitrilase